MLRDIAEASMKHALDGFLHGGCIVLVLGPDGLDCRPQLQTFFGRELGCPFFRVHQVSSGLGKASAHGIGDVLNPLRDLVGAHSIHCPQFVIVRRQGEAKKLLLQDLIAMPTKHDPGEFGMEFHVA